jgi:hypothetical protein
MAEKWPENGRKKAGKWRDEAPISVDYTAHFARNWSKMAVNSRRNETKNGACKKKNTLGPTCGTKPRRGSPAALPGADV